MSSLARLPMIFESRGGVREIIISISWRTQALELLGVDLGVRVPEGATLTSDRSEADDRTVLRLTLRSQTDLPAGVLDLLTLTVRSELLATGGLAEADLLLTVLAINGADVCAPLTGGSALRADADTLLPPKPMHLVDAGRELGEVADAAINLSLDLFGAEVHHPGAIYPDLLPDGLLALRASGIAAAGSMVLRFTYDAAALELAGAAPGMPGVEARLIHLSEGTAELHLSAVEGVAQGAFVLASLALMRRVTGTGMGVRRGGLVRLTAVRVDGIDLMLTEADADLTETPTPAYPLPRSMRWNVKPDVAAE